MNEPPAGAARPFVPLPDAWNNDPFLVAEDGARLPPRCIKTNQTASTYVRYRFSRTSPAAIFLLPVLCIPVVNIMALIAISAIFTSTVRIEVAVSEEVCAGLRRQHLKVLFVFLLYASVIPLVYMLAGQPPLLPFLLFAPVFLAASPKVPLRVSKIEGRRAFIRGAGLEFLQSLPDYPK